MFANPWGLLGLLSLPTILAIHLYHRRFPPLVIAGAHLWGADTEVRDAGRRRDRLPITATLLLELLAGLLLTLLLARPTFGDPDAVAHLVVVLDDSASMSAHSPGGDSFRDRAIGELRERASELGRDSVFTLVLSGRRGVLGGSAISWNKASAALGDWKPSAPGHAFAPAWDYAARIAEQTGGTLLFLTDHLSTEEAELPEGMEVVSLGEPVENVAITAARWSFDSKSAQGRVFLRVSNVGTKSAQVTITGRSDGQLAFERTEEIAADGSLPLEVDVPGGLGTLRISLQAAGDGLSLDDSVELIEPKPRTVTVAVTLPADAPERALVERALSGMSDIQTGNVADAHLLIGPANDLPPSREDLWWLGIGPYDRSEEAREKAANFAGGYLIEKRHPLLEGIALGNEIWAGAQPIDLDLYPLVRAGEHVLLGRLQGTRTTGFLLNIDLPQSHLPRTPNWPILISNLIEMRRDALPGLRRWNYRLLESPRFRWDAHLVNTTAPADSSAPPMLVEDEATTQLALEADDMIVIGQLNTPGIREIRAGDELVDRFAANFFDPAESKLVGLHAGRRPPAAASPPPSLRPEDPYTWILLAGLTLVLLGLLLDWSILRPKGSGAVSAGGRSEAAR